MINKELSDLIQKVHESIEGRYDLTGNDLTEIHSLLCDLQKQEPDPRDLGLDDSWVHDVEMGAR